MNTVSPQRMQFMEFRAKVKALHVPVEVVLGGKTLGFYYPGPVRPDSIGEMRKSVGIAIQMLDAAQPITPDEDDGAATAPVPTRPHPSSGGPGVALEEVRTHE